MKFKNLRKQSKNRKGFSLVELVVVILIIAILAVAVFAGGSAVIKKAQVSRTTSDLHNFSVAVEGFMNAHPELLNVASTDKFDALDDDLIKSLNNELAQDYQLEACPATLSTTSGGNLTTTPSSTAKVFQSVKTDAWDNHYYVILDFAERHGTSNSDFYITVVSAGPDAKTDLGAQIGGSVEDGKEDDIFLLAQNTNGDVTAATYDLSGNDTIYCATVNDTTGTWTVGELTRHKDASAPVGLYSYTPASGTYGADAVKCPVNF